MDNVVKKFQFAFSGMDITSLSECLSSGVTYAAKPSGKALSGKPAVITFLNIKFEVFRDLDAVVSTVQSKSHPSEFTVFFRYEALRPVSGYMVSNDGISVVVTLEPRGICMEVTVRVQCRENRISKIKIFQKEIIECRKTAQSNISFAASMIKNRINPNQEN